MTASVMSLINALGWTLIQSIWQALLILAVLRLLLALLPHAPAAAKYNLSLGALALTFMGFILTFYTRWQSLHPSAVFYQQGLSAAPSAALAPVLPGISPSASFFTPAGWFSWLAVLYLAGLLVFLGKMVRDAGFLWHVRSSRRPPLQAAWESCLLKWQTKLGLVCKIRLFMSERVDVPVAAGFLKPVIYLPFTLAGSLDPEQIEAILLHELAHICRRDFLVNIFQTLAETVLFFNPFVWMMSRMIRRERENSCDDIVLSSLEPGLYASALLALEENRLYRGGLVLAAAGKKAQLFQRIKRIMEMKTRKLNVFQRLLVLLVLSGSLVSLGWLVPASREASRPFGNDRHKAATVAVSTAPRKDTSAPVPSPAARPTAPALRNPAPPPPPPAADVLPAPPPPPSGQPADTGTFTFRGWLPPKMPDSLVNMIRNSTKSYFGSKQWKEYQRKMAQYGADMAERGREYARKMKPYGDSMQRYFNSAAWKKYQHDLQQYAQNLTAYFQNKEWTDQIKAISYQAEKARERGKLDAQRSLDSLNSRLHLLQDLAPEGHQVNAKWIAAMLKQDGLISDRNNFRVRINDRGLFVNGRKQDRKYFEKYRRLVGPDTRVEIKVKNGNTDTSISTHKKSTGSD